MAIAKIRRFNIKSYPKDTVFVLDTNVLYFIHSGYVMQSNFKGLQYSNVIKTILENGYTIEVSSLNIQELFHLIEKKEYELYCIANSKTPETYKKKDYRKDLSQRTRLKAKLCTILSELSLYKLKDGNITVKMLHDFSNNFDLHQMDPIDYVLVQGYNFSKTVFISDDKDFQSNPSISVLTV